MKSQKNAINYFSGKSLKYAVKLQIVFALNNKKIINILASNGKNHDFKIFKEKKIKFLAKTTVLVDSGYQELQKIHPKAILPTKKTKNKKLTNFEKYKNRTIAKTRIKVEHVFGWLKRFKILVHNCRKSIFRLMYLRFKLICGLFNHKNNKVTSA